MTAFKKSSLPTCRLLMCRWCDSSAATWSLWSRRVEGTLAISSLPTARGSSSRRLEMRLTMGEWARNLSILSVNKTSHKFLSFLQAGLRKPAQATPMAKDRTQGGKNVFLNFYFYCSPKIKTSFERNFCQKPFHLFLNLFSYPPGLTLVQCFVWSGPCLG